MLAALPVLYLLAQAPAEHEPDHVSAVVRLDKRNFYELVVESEQLWLLKFYAPWCGHCKRMAPVLEEVAEQFDADGRPASFGRIDCTAGVSTCEPRRWTSTLQKMRRPIPKTIGLLMAALAAVATGSRIRKCGLT